MSYKATQKIVLVSPHLMCSEPVAQSCQGKDVESPPQEDEDDAPDYQRHLEAVREGEDADPEVGEHAGLAHERQGT